MEFTPKKQMNIPRVSYSSGSVRHKPYPSGGKVYLKRYRAKNNGAAKPSSTPPGTREPKRYVSRADRIISSSLSPRNNSSNLGKWLTRKSPPATKRPFNAVGGAEPAKILFDALFTKTYDEEHQNKSSKVFLDSSDSDDLIPEDSSSTIRSNTPKVYSKKEPPTLGRPALTSKTVEREEDEKENVPTEVRDEPKVSNNILPHLTSSSNKVNSPKVYSKKKPLMQLKSPLLADIAPEVVEKAFGVKTVARKEDEKENVPTATTDETKVPSATPPHLIGFPNYGNTCYLNSVIQSLLGLPSFLGDLQVVSSQLSLPYTSVSYSLSQIIAGRLKGQVAMVKKSLKAVKENLVRVDESFSGSKMQDANEFLTRMLDTIKDEIDRCCMSTPNPDRPTEAKTTLPSSSTNSSGVDDVLLISKAGSSSSVVAKQAERTHVGNGDEAVGNSALFKVVFNEKQNSAVKVPHGTKEKRSGRIFDDSEEEDEEQTSTPVHASSYPSPENQSMPRNLVKDNFEFQLLESYKCLGCGEVEGRKQEYFGLYVNLPGEDQKTLQDAITSYMGTDQRELKCSHCSHNQSNVVTAITSLPRILIVQLKRYEYSVEQGDSMKRSSRVLINRWLSLDPFTTDEVLPPPPWSPHAVSPHKLPVPKQPTLTARNLLSELNVCEGNKEQEETLTSDPGKSTTAGPATALLPVPLDDELEEGIRRSLDDIGVSKEDEEIQQAIKLSLQDLGLSYSREDQGQLPEEQVEEINPTMVAQEAPDSDCHAYRLVSIISHNGAKTSIGHYVGDVYNFKENCWFHYDDDYVSKVPESVVYSESRQKNGYMFFYMHKSML